MSSERYENQINHPNSDNELRDRIAEVLENVGNAWDAQMMASIVDDKPEPTRPLANAQAQAIIDDLGLTVESSMFGGRKDEGAPYRAARIVGKWERQ